MALKPGFKRPKLPIGRLYGCGKPSKMKHPGGQVLDRDRTAEPRRATNRDHRFVYARRHDNSQYCI